MVHNVIHATYTETYDLNTVNNELSLLAIHTPQANTLKAMFHGLFEQYKKFKILGCNFKMVCASQQALDPTLVGMGTGQVDPRDVLNPILFKACTGESLNALLDQIYNASQDSVTGNYGHSVDQHIDNHQISMDAYYTLLADDSFRREHPQRGITVMGLKPYVHKVVTTQPFKWSVTGRVTAAPLNSSTDTPGITGVASTSAAATPYAFGSQSGSNDHSSDPVNPSVFVSNGLTDMPWLDTSYTIPHSYVDGSGTSSGINVAKSLITNIPRVYMGCIVLPPSAGTVNLYFRMQIVWHIQFKDFRPSIDLMPVVAPGPIDSNEMGNMGIGLSEKIGYFNLYHTASKLAKDYGSIDTTGVESVEVVNEKVN